MPYNDRYPDGFNAFYAGMHWQDCPYIPHTLEWETWVKGWEQAEDSAYNMSTPSREKEKK